MPPSLVLKPHASYTAVATSMWSLAQPMHLSMAVAVTVLPLHLIVMDLPEVPLHFSSEGLTATYMLLAS